jgi:DhnA family fructose-bisphosphate aldolase class Ia
VASGGGSPRLRRLFGEGGRAVIVACDHGEFDGPPAGLSDPLDVVGSLTPGIDGVLMSPGTLERAGEVLGHRNAAVPIVRLNWNTVYRFSEAPRLATGCEVLGPDDALRLGADVALVSLTLRSGDEGTDASNVSLFSRLVHGCKRVGLPVIGEYFPLAAPAPGEMDTIRDEITCGARIAAELGADAVKTFVDPTWVDLTETCPVPVLGLGSARMASDVDALTLAHGQVRAGARGVIFGRNVFQSAEPQRFMTALSLVVHHDVLPETAWEKAAD